MGGLSADVRAAGDRWPLAWPTDAFSCDLTPERCREFLAHLPERGYPVDLEEER